MDFISIQTTASKADALRRLRAGLVRHARVDVFIHRIGTPEEQMEEGLRRARLYREAGADCIYPIILSDQPMLSAIVEAVDVVNATVRRGGPLSLHQAAAI